MYGVWEDVYFGFGYGSAKGGVGEMLVGSEWHLGLVRNATDRR